MNLIKEILQKKKVKLVTLQRVCGVLNFLCRCIVPGRAFTRRLYAYTSNLYSDKKLKTHHHVWVNAEMRSDLKDVA